MNSYSYSPTAHEAQRMQWQIQAPRIWGRIWGGLSPLLCRVKMVLKCAFILSVCFCTTICPEAKQLLLGEDMAIGRLWIRH